jgi:hypothetical protein
VRATPEAVYRAAREVTSREIRFFGLLASLRWPGRLRTRRDEPFPPQEESAPILELATRTRFVWLADDPPREVVIGTTLSGGPGRARSADAFHALTGEGSVKTAANFRIEAEEGGVRLTTETRVIAVGAGARRRFGLYWALIFPGSSIIRHGWLAAIRTRAERSPR